MKIRSTYSIRYVLNRNGWIISQAGDALTKKISEAKCRNYFKIGLFKKVYPKYNPLELTGCEMKDLREMQYTGDLNEHFINVLSVQLGLNEKQIFKLPYIHAMQVYLQTTQTASKIFAKFNGLDFPMTAEEREAQYPRNSLGLFDLVRSFCKLMPMYTIKDAWCLDWELVFTELEANRAEILTQRQLTKIKSK